MISLNHYGAAVRSFECSVRSKLFCLYGLKTRLQKAGSMLPEYHNRRESGVPTAKTACR